MRNFSGIAYWCRLVPSVYLCSPSFAVSNYLSCAYRMTMWNPHVSGLVLRAQYVPEECGSWQIICCQCPYVLQPAVKDPTPFDVDNSLWVIAMFLVESFASITSSCFIGLHFALFCASEIGASIAVPVHNQSVLTNARSGLAYKSTNVYPLTLRVAIYLSALSSFLTISPYLAHTTFLTLSGIRKHVLR